MCFIPWCAPGSVASGLMAKAAYNDPEYRRAKRWLKAHPETTCSFPGCDRPATTIDHRPALANHRHVRGAGCCQLLPACHACNSADGARIRNRRSSTGFDWP